MAWFTSMSLEHLAQTRSHTQTHTHTDTLPHMQTHAEEKKTLTFALSDSSTAELIHSEWADGSEQPLNP